MVEKQGMSILITAFAILISAIVQAGTFALSDCHASIILNLSWMNNTSTFVCFLLYIGYKSRSNDTGAIVELSWKLTNLCYWLIDSVMSCWSELEPEPATPELVCVNEESPPLSEDDSDDDKSSDIRAIWAGLIISLHYTCQMIYMRRHSRYR
jgi:hypothetical protein